MILWTDHTKVGNLEEADNLIPFQRATMKMTNFLLTVWLPDTLKTCQVSRLAYKDFESIVCNSFPHITVY